MNDKWTSRAYYLNAGKCEKLIIKIVKRWNKWRNNRLNIWNDQESQLTAIILMFLTAFATAITLYFLGVIK